MSLLLCPQPRPDDSGRRVCSNRGGRRQAGDAGESPNQVNLFRSDSKARRAQVARARARASAQARELREAQTPRFRVDEFGREVPDVRAEAAIIYNPETNEILWADHAEDCDRLPASPR